MLLLMFGAGKDCLRLTQCVLPATSRRATPAHTHIKLNIEKCRNLLLFLLLVPTEPALYRI